MSAVAEMTGQTPKELSDLVTIPVSLQECWYWFLRLNSTRPSGFGMDAISYTEMQAFFNLHQIDVEPSEIEIIKMFDHIALQQHKETQEKQSKANSAKKSK